MSKKNKLLLGSLSCLGLFLGITICILYNNKIVKADAKDDILNDKRISIMLETGADTGSYKLANTSKWPGSGYEFNSEMSYCEKGGTLAWDEDLNTISVNIKNTDKCFVYFDVLPPDVSIGVNNMPTAIGKVGSVNCSNATSNYNQTYNRVEISEINNKYTSCSLNYTDNSSTTNLASHVIGLSGTTQGTGQVVNEVVGVGNYTNATTIAKSGYSNIKTYSSTSEESTSGTTVSNKFTFANNKWTSVASGLTSETFYHFQFTPTEQGYYQLCYDINTGHSGNRLYTYVASIKMHYGSSYYTNANVNNTKSGCIELNYLSTSSTVRVIQRAFNNSGASTIASMSFYLKKGSYNSYSGNYRYEGKNPNNYVWFNNELWRIIGVFNNTTHGQSGKNLVKIIRTTTLGGYARNQAGVTTWSSSGLYKMLNNTYYNADNGTGNDYCYLTTGIKADCDFRTKGIQPGYRNMIASVNWFTDGPDESYYSPYKFYSLERNGSKVNGKVGLMYPSDYGYGVLSSVCSRINTFEEYLGSGCASQNWLYQYSLSWFNTQTTAKNPYYLHDYGNIYPVQTTNAYSVYPTVYLDSSVYFTSGNGSISSPYILGM